MTTPIESRLPEATARLLAQFGRGDHSALEDLYARYFDRLHAVVRLRMGPGLRVKMESMDVVQDAFAASLRSVGGYSANSEGGFFHWLCKIAENRIRDHAKHWARDKRDIHREGPIERQRPSGDSFFGPISELAVHTSPATRAALAEDIRRLEDAIDLLPTDQREALVLVRYEQLTFQEAAELMHKTPDAVRMLAARAIVSLGKNLGDTST